MSESTNRWFSKPGSIRPIKVRLAVVGVSRASIDLAGPHRDPSALTPELPDHGGSKLRKLRYSIKEFPCHRRRARRFAEICGLFKSTQKRFEQWEQKGEFCSTDRHPVTSYECDRVPATGRPGFLPPLQALCDRDHSSVVGAGCGRLPGAHRLDSTGIEPAVRTCCDGRTLTTRARSRRLPSAEPVASR